MEGREKVLRQALHNVNKTSLQHGCLCTPLGRNFRDKQNLQRYFKRARLLLLSWNEFDLDSSCWLAVNWDFTQSDVSSNDHDWLWLLTNNLRLDCLNMSIMQAQPHCVELLLRLICLCVYVVWFCWVNVILLFTQRCGLCVFFIYFSSFALSICFKSLGRYELFQSLFQYFYVELNSAWTFITDACIRSGAIQHQDSFSLDKEVHWYCWITWSLWILAVFWRHCCCLRHWVTYLLVRVKIFYGKMSHSSEWEEIWNRGGTLQSDDVCWSLYTPCCFLLRQTFLCLTKLWVLCGFMGFMLLL